MKILFRHEKASAVKLWSCEAVKLWSCEAVKLWSCEAVKLWSCEFCPILYCVSSALLLFSHFFGENICNFYRSVCLSLQYSVVRFYKDFNLFGNFFNFFYLTAGSAKSAEGVIMFWWHILLFILGVPCGPGGFIVHLLQCDDGKNRMKYISSAKSYFCYTS